jgi:hypothetical protein
MNETTQMDRIKSRSTILTDVLQRQDIQNLAKGLSDILSGEQIRKMVGKWYLEYSYPHHLNLVHIDAERKRVDTDLAFLIYMKEGGIILENGHRRAYYGSGVSSFAEVEHAVAALATLRKMPVSLVYILFGQRDTEQFLTMRDYNKISWKAQSGSEVPAMIRLFPPRI